MLTLSTRQARYHSKGYSTTPPSRPEYQRQRTGGCWASGTTWPSWAFFQRNFSWDSSFVSPQLCPEADSIKAGMRHFVVSNFLFRQGGNALRNDASFIQKGIIDSTGVLEVSTFIEEAFRIKIPDDELTLDNFDSIERLAQYIRQKCTP